MDYSVVLVTIFQWKLLSFFNIEIIKTIRTSPEGLDSHYRAFYLSWDNDSESPISTVSVGQPGGRRDG